jgi:hypothetical protein
MRPRIVSFVQCAKDDGQEELKRDERLGKEWLCFEQSNPCGWFECFPALHLRPRIPHISPDKLLSAEPRDVCTAMTLCQEFHSET